MDETRKIFDLNGAFHFKVDAKGRVSLPSKFRKALGEDLVVTPDLQEKHLMVFEQEAFNAWINDLFEKRFGGYNVSSVEHQDLRRALKGRAVDVEVDNAGRILLPADTRATARIDRDVVIVGNTGFFEIWDAKRYDSKNAEVDITALLTL